MYKPIKSTQFPGWYEIPGFSGYCANEKGHILNKKTKNFSIGGRAGRYLKVSAYKDGATKAGLYYIHILICTAFYGPPSGDKQVVMHLDNNRNNNTKKNLRWGTQSENILQVYKDGLKYSKKYAYSKESRPIWAHWGECSLDLTMEDYEYVSINSSNIYTIGYDKKKKELEITFKSNNVYIYKDVSSKRFYNLANAKSVGRYFSKFIRNNYPFKKQA